MENRELEFKEAVLVAIKTLGSFCFPHIQTQSTISAGELETALQRLHHLVALEREPVLPEPPTPRATSATTPTENRLGRQALFALLRANYLACQVRGCQGTATHLSDGLPFCEKHRAAVALELASDLGLLKTLSHETATR